MISFNAERMGQGRENRVFLKEHKDIREKLETALRQKARDPAPMEAGAGSNGTQWFTLRNRNPKSRR
jgi:hypothetical protein